MHRNRWKGDAMKRAAQESDFQAEMDGSDGDELVWGAAAIGKVINRSTRATFHLAAIGAIPVEHAGGRLVARKSKLLAIAG
jgi:hypothetical protein